jgi:hypothetical protein
MIPKSVCLIIGRERAEEWRGVLPKRGEKGEGFILSLSPSLSLALALKDSSCALLGP